MSWIVVKDLDEAIKFYTDSVGLELTQLTKEHGWAELSGPEGARLGLAQENPQMDMVAGKNAVCCLRVDDIEAARAEFVEKGVTLLGEIIEVPGHVKMQTFQDADGNTFQLVQEFSM